MKTKVFLIVAFLMAILVSFSVANANSFNTHQSVTFESFDMSIDLVMNESPPLVSTVTNTINTEISTADPPMVTGQELYQSPQLNIYSGTLTSPVSMATEENANETAYYNIELEKKKPANVASPIGQIFSEVNTTAEIVRDNTTVLPLYHMPGLTDFNSIEANSLNRIASFSASADPGPRFLNHIGKTFVLKINIAPTNRAIALT